jgi:hypothetical protein
LTGDVGLGDELDLLRVGVAPITMSLIVCDSLLVEGFEAS